MDVSLDVFPAKVTTPGGQYGRVRALVVGRRLLVFDLDADRRPRLLVETEVAEVGLNGRKVTTVSGETWVVQYAGGCGCGDPMKRLSPSALLNLVDA